MNPILRPVLPLALMAALASAAPAAILFTGLTGNGAPFLWSNGPGTLQFDPNVADAGTGAYSGSFLVTSDAPLASVDVQVGSNLVMGGQMSFGVSLKGEPGFVYMDAAAGDGMSLKADGGSRALGKSSYRVSYALSYAGDDDSFASFSTASFNFHAAPVPEPSAFAAMGLGIAALVRRRDARSRRGR